MTYKKLATWVTIFSAIGSVLGLSLNTRMGFFSSDRGFMLSFDQGALGFVLATDGCWPNGIIAHSQVIDSHSGFLSLPLLSLTDNGVSFQIPGMVWLLGFSLVCTFLILRARRDQIQIRQLLTNKNQAEQGGDGDAEEAV